MERKERERGEKGEKGNEDERLGVKLKIKVRKGGRKGMKMKGWG